MKEVTRENFKIDFVGIGAPKSGTTWISQCLDEHPDLCHARQAGKIFETVFFENESSYRYGLKLYQKYFGHCSPSALRGEITPTYLYSPKAAQRIRSHNPQVKLLVCLRNPIERAYSHYTAHERQGKNAVYKIDSFDDIRHKHDNPYYQLGFYFKHLKQYLELFGRKNIFILIYDDLTKDPRAFIQQIYAFLGVRSDFIPPSLFKKFSAAEERGVYSKTVNKWLLYGKAGVVFSKYPLYKKVRGVLRKTGALTRAQRWIDRLNYRNKPWKRPPLPEKTRSFLQKAYRNDIAQLEKLLNRNLDCWK